MLAPGLFEVRREAELQDMCNEEMDGGFSSEPIWRHARHQGRFSVCSCSFVCRIPARNGALIFQDEFKSHDHQRIMEYLLNKNKSISKVRLNQKSVPTLARVS